MTANPMQLENAEIPMLVTLSGSVMLVKPLQYANALSPMLVNALPAAKLTDVIFGLL
jgi:hypothetical protein